MISLKLPSFMVSVHIKCNDFSVTLEEELKQKMSRFELDEAGKDGDIQEYHWSLASWDEAIKIMESLSNFKQNPNLMLLQAKANYDESINPVVLRDDRRPHRVNVD